MTTMANGRRASAMALVSLAAFGRACCAEGASDWRWPPQQWMTFGPVSPDTKPGPRGLPNPNELLPKATLRSIPQTMTIAGKIFRGRGIPLRHRSLARHEIKRIRQGMAK